MHSELNPSELNRYNRHILIPEIGLEGQLLLTKAKVLVIGAGGLGCPILQYLAAAGVGNIGIVDFDIVDESNLQRQILFTTDDIGNSKAITAQKRLLALNPHIEVKAFHTKITSENAFQLINNYDIIIDGTDNFPTRYLVNDACVLKNKINVFGSIFRFEGQVSVFNYPMEDGTRSPNYRDLFPNPPAHGSVPSCAEAGVFGVLPGIIGSIQASEVIKIITKVGEPLAGKLLILDTTSFIQRVLNIRKNPHVVINQLIDYDEFCGVPKPSISKPIQEITYQQFVKQQSEGADFFLVDVRQDFEHELKNIGGLLIPLGEIINRKDEIPRDQPVLFYCKSGARSGLAVQKLQYLYGFENLTNMTGGFI